MAKIEEGICQVSVQLGGDSNGRMRVGNSSTLDFPLGEDGKDTPTLGDTVGENTTRHSGKTTGLHVQRTLKYSSLLTHLFHF